MFDIIEKYSSLPFEWGVNDCCLFSANIIKDWKGIDYAAPLRNMYVDKETAYSSLETVCGTTNLIEALDVLLNTNHRSDFENIEVGDFVAVRNKEGSYSIGVNYGARSYFQTEERGVSALPNRMCEVYWKIV